MSDFPRTCLLLVEDDPLVRVTVAMMLEDEGFGVVEASDAAGALQLIQDGVVASVMVTDVDLGAGLSGAELADSLRQMRPEMPIIFITGRVASLDGHHMGPLDAVLPKPFATRTLSKLVREMTG